MNEISIKLSIDGQEAVQVLRLTQTEYNKLYSKFSGFPGFPPQALQSMKALQSELLKVDHSTEETIQATSEFIRMYGLSETQIQKVLSSLREEQKGLAIGTAEYRTRSAAIQNLTGAYNNVQGNQAAVVKTTEKLTETNARLTQGSNSMNMAIGQFGYLLSDADMFLVNFRMGLMSVANNIPMVIQYFQYAQRDASALGQTLGQNLVKSLVGPGGLLLAVNAVMLVLQLLPSLFRETTAEVKKQKEAVDELKDEYEKLTSVQLESQLKDLEKQLQEYNGKYPKQYETQINLNPFQAFGGRSPMSKAEVSDEKRYGEDYESVRQLKERIALVQRELLYKGQLEDADLRLAANREKLRNLNKNNYSLIVPDAKSFAEAEKTLKSWIEADEKMTKPKKEKVETYEDKVSKTIKYYEELTKIDKSYNAAYKAYLDDQLNYYLNTLAKQKGGLKNLSGDQLAAVNEIRDRLNNKFAPRPDFSNFQAKGLDERGMQGLPLSDKENQERKDALRKQKEINKMKAELLGESYSDEKQQIEDWYEFSLERYQLDLENHKTTTEEKAVIDDLYHKKLQDLEGKTLEKKLNAYQQAAESVSKMFGSIYSMAEQSAMDEIDAWYKKEDKKLDEEHKNALKYARTAKQKEKADEQYQKKKDQLDEEANNRAKERLITWFTISKHISAASAIIASIVAGTNTLQQLSKYLPPPFPEIAMGATIAAGIAEAVKIEQQKVPGYAKGSVAVVGENGPEIIAPLDTYAQGQAQLINQTIAAVRQDLGNTSNAFSDPAIISEIMLLNQNFEKYANTPIPIVNTFNRNFARQSVRMGLAQMKREKLV